MLPQKKMFNCLVASENRLLEKPVSDMYVYPLVPSLLTVKRRMADMTPPPHSVKLQIIYGLKMSETADLDTFTIQTCISCTACMVGSYSQGGETCLEPAVHISDSEVGLLLSLSLVCPVRNLICISFLICAILNTPNNLWLVHGYYYSC